MAVSEAPAETFDRLLNIVLCGNEMSLYRIVGCRPLYGFGFEREIKFLVYL